MQVEMRWFEKKSIESTRPNEHVRHELFPSFILNQRDICSFKYLANENYMLLAKFLKTVFKNR